MQSVPGGYTGGKKLYSSRLTEVYEAVRNADGAPVVLKGYLADRSSDPDPRAQREHDALRRCECSQTPRALDLDRTTQRPLLVLERLPGIPLARVLAEAPLSIARWLDVACALVDALACIHAARILHKDVQPANVLLDAPSGRVWLIDFGMAAELGAAEPPSAQSGTLQVTLSYVAPEQTGRMSRGCDSRSDLYSLGATLFAAWTGRPPFDATDPLELIHAHIARVPVAPNELRDGLPSTLSRIVEKLLRKEPEERYQTARALRADLEACRSQWTQSGAIDDGFDLGAADTTVRPRFSARLHGREREITRLHDGYSRACTGVAQTLWLAGGPGTGKTTLVDALRSAVVRSGGYFSIGKFDLYQERPYEGWVRALGSLAQQLLLESDERLEQWRGELRAGLGGIARAIVDLVPDFGFVIGEAPPITPLGPRETQARLSLALHRLISVCATPAHPLVLLLDDLQWSDAASRALLENLVVEKFPAALLLIGTYRSDEVAPTHPLDALLGRIARSGAASESVDVLPLGKDAVVSMLAEALDRTHDEVHGLAELVERKTGNNALLVRQFIEDLHERGLMRHSRAEGWTWDPLAIASESIPEGAVALMTAKVDRLTPKERAVLQLASCVGTEFDVALLCELGRRERTAVAAGLYTLCDKGLIIPCPAGFRFVHDRVREAAQRLLSEAERALLHCEIARLLLERIPEHERSERAREIAEHINRGLDHLGSEERMSAVEVNLAAGKRALASGASATAARYFAFARQLFAEDDWTEHHALGFDLLMQSADSAFLGGELDAALQLLAQLDARARSLVERATVAAKRIQVLILTENAEDVTRYTLDVARSMGVHWPLHPSALRARLTVRWMDWRLRGRTPEQLLRPARRLDPAWFAPLVVLAAGSAALLRADQPLSAIATCHALRQYLRHGYVRAPGFAITIYACNRSLMLGDPARASRLARAALACPGFPQDPAMAIKAEQAILTMIDVWRMPRRQAFAALDSLEERARELGDPEFVYYAAFSRAYYFTLTGDPIPVCDARLGELIRMAASTLGASSGAGDYQHTLRHLLSHPPVGELERALAESDVRIAALRGATEPYARTLWLLVLCVYERFDLAFEQSEKLGERLFRTIPLVHVADHTFYRGLAAAELARTSRGGTARRARRALRAARHHLKRWAVQGPDFVHMQLLLEAEAKRLRGRLHAARQCYEQGAARALQQGHVHHAALACERRGRLLAAQRRETEAARAFEEARALYSDWGALPKAESLARELAR